MTDEQVNSKSNSQSVVTKLDFDGVPFWEVVIERPRSVSLNIAFIVMIVCIGLFFGFMAQSMRFVIRDTLIQSRNEFVASMVISLAFSILWNRRKSRRIINEGIAVAKREDIGHTIAYVSKKSTDKYYSHTIRLIRALVMSGETDKTVRVCIKNTFAIMQPINTSFEPCNLWQWDERFQLLAGAFSGNDSKHIQREHDALGRSLKVQKTATRSLVWMGVTLWTLCAFLVGIALFAYSSIGFQSPAFWAPGVIAFCLVPLAFVYSLNRAPMTESNWQFIPGGLLYVRPMGWPFGPRAHAFIRTNSILMLHDNGIGMWELWVCDRHFSKRHTIQAPEAQMLLRAWLSPVPPPTDEQLAQLLPS